MVIAVSTRVNDDLSTDDSESGGELDAHTAPTVESYETDTGVVFYDSENPLAWVETEEPISLADLV